MVYIPEILEDATCIWKICLVFFVLQPAHRKHSKAVLHNRKTAADWNRVHLDY